MKALVVYHSQQYGNTERMAEAVAEGLIKAGCTVTTHNTNNGRFPIEEYPGYDVVAFGTPDYFSYLAGTIKTLIDDWYIQRNKPGYKDKAFGLFLTHGGGGRAVDALTIFKHLGHQVGETVVCSGAPDAKTIEKCRELGKLLAEA